VTEFLRRWGPALLWTAVLFGASSRQSLPVDLHSGTDKLAHFGAYAVLGLLLAHGQLRSGISVLWVMLFGSLIGGMDELYQGTVPNRSPDLHDWVADSLGVVAGVFLFNLWWHARSYGRARARRRQPVPHE
jgi:VanZ family protein